MAEWEFNDCEHVIKAGKIERFHIARRGARRTERREKEKINLSLDGSAASFECWKCLQGVWPDSSSETIPHVVVVNLEKWSGEGFRGESASFGARQKSGDALL